MARLIMSPTPFLSAFAALLMASPPAAAQSSVEFIKSTPCLYELRFWRLDRKFGEPFKIPEGMTAEQCAEAERAEARLAEIQQREAEEDARLMAKRQAEEERLMREAEKRLREIANRPGAKVGMSARDVINRTNWGEPLYKNTTITARGKREQWVYGDGQYLYFENGRLTAIQQRD